MSICISRELLADDKALAAYLRKVLSEGTGEIHLHVLPDEPVTFSTPSNDGTSWVEEAIKRAGEWLGEKPQRVAKSSLRPVVYTGATLNGVPMPALRSYPIECPVVLYVPPAKLTADEFDAALETIAGEGEHAPYLDLRSPDDLLIDGHVTLAQLKQLVALMERQL